LTITTVNHHFLKRYTKHGEKGHHNGKDYWTTKRTTKSKNHGGINDLHKIQHSAGYEKDMDVINRLDVAEEAFWCVDQCAGDLTSTVEVSLHWKTCDGKTIGTGQGKRGAYKTASGALKGFNTLKVGTYVLKYVCKDKPCHGKVHSHKKCRTIVNEDHTKPVITIIGTDDMTFEANHDYNYIDDGATCSDRVDGWINENIEVSGDVVNLAKVGYYHIIYNCKDKNGNAAEPAVRTVLVQDTICPTCKIKGSEKVTREASFPYVDAGAVCTDTLSGTVKVHVANNVNVERVGEYEVTYTAHDAVHNWNYGRPGAYAVCRDDGKFGSKGANTYTRFVVVEDTEKPVITLRYQGKLVHTSEALDRGVNDQPNPAGWFGFDEHLRVGKHPNANKIGNPQMYPARGMKETHRAYRGVPNYSLMAEQSSSVNGWMIGAIASATVGVALFVFGNRRQTTQIAL